MITHILKVEEGVGPSSIRYPALIVHESSQCVVLATADSEGTCVHAGTGGNSVGITHKDNGGWTFPNEHWVYLPFGTVLALENI